MDKTGVAERFAEFYKRIQAFCHQEEIDSNDEFNKNNDCDIEPDHKIFSYHEGDR